MTLSCKAAPSPGCHLGTKLCLTHFAAINGFYAYLSNQVEGTVKIRDSPQLFSIARDLRGMRDCVSYMSPSCLSHYLRGLTHNLLHCSSQRLSCTFATPSPGALTSQGCLPGLENRRPPDDRLHHRPHCNQPLRWRARTLESEKCCPKHTCTPREAHGSHRARTRVRGTTQHTLASRRAALWRRRSPSVTPVTGRVPDFSVEWYIYVIYITLWWWIPSAVFTGVPEEYHSLLWPIKIKVSNNNRTIPTQILV